MFSAVQSDYIRSQRLARIATVGAADQPDVAPVGFDFDGEHVYVGGYRMERTYKYHNVRDNDRLAIVFDDLVSLDAWQPRGVKVHGRGVLMERDGYAGAGQYIQITPERVWSWGLEDGGSE